VRASDQPHIIWRKSSRSNDGGEGACVEVAELPSRVAMRDSKDPTGPVLAVTRAEWRAFIGSIRASDLG
jgi:hypothetical protein